MAASKWKVFKEDRLLGSFSAKQIREALRSGAIDPFDLVCQEGSQIKLRLVEVDEIFATTDEVETADKAGTDFHTAETKPPMAIERDRPYERAAAPETVFTNEPSRRDYGRYRPSASSNKNVKKFFVRDKQNRVLGPLSASEVQSLFYRGILANNVRVQKSGESKSISIKTFIASYSGERVQEIANADGSGKKSTPALQNLSSAALNEFYKGISTKDLTQSTYIKLGAFAFVGILLGFLMYSALHPKLPSDDNRSASKEEVSSSKSGKGKPRLRLSKSVAIEDEPMIIKPRRQYQQPKPAKRQSQPKVERAERPRTRNNTVAVVTPKRTTSSARPKPEAQKPPRPVSKPQPAPKAAPPKQVASAAPSSSLASQVGKVVQFGPAIFSKSVLESCAVKCQVKFMNGNSEQVTGVFFKAGYYSQLKAAPGRVTLTGRLSKEGGGYVVFLQNVANTP